MTRVFDPDDDPEQVAAARKAASRDPLAEPDLIKAEAEKAAQLKRDIQANPLGEPGNIAAEMAAIQGDPPVPRDAATLILFRREADGPRILMGCRSEGHDFMPNKYVFPGGRVDDEDVSAPALSELSEEVDAPLRIGAQRATRAFPLTAIREVFEETGLIVGRASQPMPSVPPSWSGYYAQGAAPCLANFRFLGRAITPPMRHKRFDARFFMADAADALIDNRPPMDGRELNDLRWFTLPEVAALDLPNVTRFVISEVEARLVRNEAVRPFHLYWTPTGHVRERL